MTATPRDRESQIEKAVVDHAENLGWLIRKVKWIGRRAAPDRVFFKAGRTIWVEFKRPGEKPRLLQEREHTRMRDAGCEVHVIDDVRAGCDLFD